MSVPSPPSAEFTEAFRRAASLREQGRVEEAVLGFREAIRLSPGSAAAHGNLAILLAVTGRAEEAVTEFRAALAADEGDEGARFHLGMLLAKLGRPAEAAAAYQGFLAHAKLTPPGYQDYARRQIQLLRGSADAGRPEAPAATDGDKPGGGLWFSLFGRVAAPTLGAGTAVGTAADVAGLRGLAARAAASNPVLAGGACVLAAASALVGIPWAIATRGTGAERRAADSGPAFVQRGAAERSDEEAVGAAEEAPAQSSLISFADKMLSSPPTPAPPRSEPALRPGPFRPAAAPTAGAGVPAGARRAPDRPRLTADPGASGGFSGQFQPLQRRDRPDAGTEASPAAGREGSSRAHAIHAERAIGQLEFAERQAQQGASARSESAAAAMADGSFAQQTARGDEGDEELEACARKAKSAGGVEACRKDVKRRRAAEAGAGAGRR